MKEIKTHTTSVITTHKGIKIPLILLYKYSNTPYSNISIIYLKVLKKQNKTLKNLMNKARELCYLFDYYFEFTPKDIKEQRIFIENFTKELKQGFNLNWKIKSLANRQSIFHTCKDFIDFICSHEYIFDEEEKHFIETIKECDKFIEKIPNPIFKKKYLYQRETNSNQIIKSFPVDKIIELISSTNNIRSKIIYILFAFGGIKSSQVLNIFIDDIKIENNKLTIKIADPENSYIKDLKRSDYLKIFNLKARNKREDSYHVGWKKPKYQYPEKLESEIIFIGKVESYLIDLIKDYMSWRKDFKDNPYFFLSSDGKPLKQVNLNYCFYSDCERIGLDIKEEGVKPYGLRHFYGYYISRVLEIDRLLVQRLMGYTESHHVDKFYVDKEESFQKLKFLEEVN